MKIGIITIHYANSYGGTLQSLATQEILRKYGEAQIIDYRNDELNKTLSTIRIGHRPRDFLRMAKDIFRLAPRARLTSKFKTFINQRYNLTKTCKTTEDLNHLSNSFDVLVCGSDQIWNPKIVGGFDKNYMLGFSNSVKKISLSSSAGSYNYTPEERKIVKELLGDFRSIAVRETDTALEIKEITGRNDIQNTIDPTLLLSKYEWLKLLDIKEDTSAEKYLLTYTLKKNRFTKETVKKIASKLNLKIIAIDQDPYLGYPAHKHVMDASPVEFVKLFANASFVVTNSFHGTAFSVNFKIPFLTIKPESGTNRVSSFLTAVGLADRLVQSDEEIITAIKSAPNFRDAHKSLNNLREISSKYIRTALSV